MLRKILFQISVALFLVPLALAEGEAAGSPGQGIMGFLPLIAIFVIFYFLLIRPQQKKSKEHKEMLSRVAKDDTIVTTGGLYGKVTGVSEDFVTVEIAPNVRVKILKSHIAHRKV